MGLIVTILILPFVLSGVLARSRLVSSTENQEKALSFKRFHKYAGWFMIIVTQITIAFGIYSYTHNRDIETILYWVSLAIAFFTILIFGI